MKSSILGVVNLLCFFCSSPLLRWLSDPNSKAVNHIKLQQDLNLLHAHCCCSVACPLLYIESSQLSSTLPPTRAKTLWDTLQTTRYIWSAVNKAKLFEQLKVKEQPGWNILAQILSSVKSAECMEKLPTAHSLYDVFFEWPPYYIITDNKE